MDSKKRIISLVLAIVLVVSLFPAYTPINAAITDGTGAVFTVGTVSGMPGGTVEVDIRIEGNPGILGATLKVAYDDGLTLVDAAAGEAFSALEMTKPGQYVSGCNFVWYAQDIAPEDIQDGVVLTLVFQVAEDVSVNQTLGVRVSADADDIFDADLEDVPFTIVSGGIYIIDYLPGDVNGDGVINTKDAVFLARYIAGGYDVTIDRAASDVNDDGKLNSKDIVVICRFLAGGYDVEPKPSTKCFHTMEAVAYKAATCTEDGNVSYYHCTTCDKYYNDSNGTAELTQASTVLAATGHSAVTDPYVAPTYESVGWTEGSHCSVCGETLNAQEEIPMLEKDEYIITYHIDLNDSYLQSIQIDNPNPTVYTTQDGLVLDKLIVDGYIFEGWYDGQGSSANEVTQIPVGTTGNITLYAHWSKVDYTVTFNSPLAETSSKTYTVDTGVTLTNPSYYGYTFVGWSDPNGNIVTSIPAGTTGNITLTANWTSKRNQTIPVSSLSKPGIIVDEETDTILFTYYIGRMENVPLYTLHNFGYVSGGGVNWSETVEYTYTISKEDALSVSNSVSDATTTTSSWTLSEAWSKDYSINSSWGSEYTQEQAAELTKAYENGGSYVIGSSVGGSTSTTTESGTSSKVAVDATVESSLSAKYMGVTAEVSGSLSTSQEDTSEYKETEASSKNWNSESSFSRSATASQSASVSSSVSSTVSSEFGIGESYGSSEEFSESNELSVSTQKSREYGSTFVYGKDETTTTSKTYSNEGTTDGYYRIVAAGSIDVFAIVGYDIATHSYFTYTYSVLDDDIYEFMDYSATTAGYDDLENGILPFEIPYDVDAYVNSLTIGNSGLVVDIDTGIITGYNGTATHVRIPEYMSLDNGDGTYSVVHVTGIASGAFAGKTTVVEVKLPDSVTEIPAGAFKGCTALTGVIAENITSIGAEAFSGCVSLESFTVSTAVTKLGADAFVDVPAITVEAYDVAVAKAAAASGAKSITLNVSSTVDVLEDYTFYIPEGTDYFAFIGGTHTYSGVRIVSDAAETVINGATFTDCEDTPLVISSEKVTLNRVTVETTGLAMQLTAPTANVALYGSVNMNTSASDAVRCNDIVLSPYNASVASKMNVSGNVLVCGTVTNEQYLNVTNGRIICYNADDTCVVTFDANGGQCDTNSMVVSCGSAVGELPTATNSGSVFYGWVDENGNVLTADTVLYVAGEMTVYAQWTEPYTITWNAGTGYTITVSRTASPLGGASIGTLSSGDTIYPEDVLSVTYTVATGYTLSTYGATAITVSGDVTSDQIYATVTANSYTYNIKYVSSNGTALGTGTVTYKYGTTNTIAPKSFSGYTSPASQSVAWDSTTAKTITFTYTPTAVTTTQTVKSGTWWSYEGTPRLTYKVTATYVSRTATSATIKVTWTNTIVKGSYYGYAQYGTVKIAGSSTVSTGKMTIASASKFSSSSDTSVARSASVSYTLTVPLNSTAAQNLTVTGSWSAGTGATGSWTGSCAIPAY